MPRCSCLFHLQISRCIISTYFTITTSDSFNSLTKNKTKNIIISQYVTSDIAIQMQQQLITYHQASHFNTNPTPPHYTIFPVKIMCCGLPPGTCDLLLGCISCFLSAVHRHVGSGTALHHLELAVGTSLPYVSLCTLYRCACSNSFLENGTFLSSTTSI